MSLILILKCLNVTKNQNITSRSNYFNELLQPEKRCFHKDSTKAPSKAVFDSLASYLCNSYARHYYLSNDIHCILSFGLEQNCVQIRIS